MRTQGAGSSAPRIAIAHDYLTQRGGAERVVLALAKGFPDAPIYTTLYDADGTFPEFRDLDVRPSRLNRVGPLRKDHRKALPLLPAAASSISVNADVVIASSSGWAHGFGGSHKTLVYCYSPARWLYQPDVYLSGNAGRLQRAGLKALSGPLRRWDRRAASRADRYLAISTIVQERIRATYDIESAILPAPLSDRLRAVAAEPLDEPVVRDGGYLLCVSRLLPYKNVDKVTRAFVQLPDHRLVVVGRGPEWDALRRDAPDNVTFLRDLTDGQMRTVYERSRGLVAASHEDYGLTPLEAALFGKPSVVLAAGGFLDTMEDGVTSVFFDSPTPGSIAGGVRRLLDSVWDERAVSAHASRFTESAFVARLRDEVASLIDPQLQQEEQ
ncbi:glycosyltransferase [Nocardioides sp. ChNu-153]|uniref:glycosyltransferase n=1 Tax=unclassified Nocardioides TaxID=2615069 RepID=UPI002405D8D3|nr:MULTISPECIES: glycosyltransferase [unclassified Nocardioides]MDF9715029.1 glycosyltransferase [Nocardioides sp. ChNu-99]MDN7122298.1 glycosyltransferase [Nocardioides sp. ChNu-153]